MGNHPNRWYEMKGSDDYLRSEACYLRATVRVQVADRP